MLRARAAFNKARKYGLGSIPLNKQERDVVNCPDDLAHRFFQRIYPWWRAHGVQIDEGVSRAEEERRSRKRNNEVVQNHFYGKFGLEAELVDAGIMDAETKVNGPK
eukprot:scaffold330165_cov72-Tisochrysis_lutea.AAC.1